MISFAPLMIKRDYRIAVILHCQSYQVELKLVAFLIMPQTPLTLKRTSNFEQNNNQNKNPNLKKQPF